MLLKQPTLLHLKWSTSTKEDTLPCKHTLPPNIPISLLLKQNKANKQTTTSSKHLECTLENMMRSLQKSRTPLSRIYLQSVLLHRVLLLAHVSETSIKQVTGRETQGFCLTAKRKQSWWKWEQPPVYFLSQNNYTCVVFNYKCKSTFWLFLPRLWSDWIVLINTDVDFSLTLNLSAKQMDSSPSLTCLSKDLINSPFQCQED